MSDIAPKAHRNHSFRFGPRRSSRVANLAFVALVLVACTSVQSKSESETSDHVVEVIALQHASAADIAVVMAAFLEDAEREYGGDAPNISVDEQSNSLIISAKPEHQHETTKLIMQLDQPQRLSH